jgi:hypothetical protein
MMQGSDAGEAAVRKTTTAERVMSYRSLSCSMLAAALVLALACSTASPASAQSSTQKGIHSDADAPVSDDNIAAPRPQLEPGQKLVIYQSVSAMHKNSAAPPGFRPAVGALVPEGIKLEPMPEAVVKVIPSVKGTDVAMIEKQVVIVDPKSRRVLDVVTHSE